MLRTKAGNKDSTARFTLVAIAEHADKSSPPRSHPSLALLRFETGLDMKTLQRAQKRLADAGLIKQVGVRGNGVVEWELSTDLMRPESDREEIDAEVQEHRERDRRRKQSARSSGTLGPDAAAVSGTENPDGSALSGTESTGQQGEVSGTQSPGFRDSATGHEGLSGTLNPDSGALSPDVRDAEPARTYQGTTRNRPTRASARARPPDARVHAREAADIEAPAVDDVDEENGVLLHMPIGAQRKAQSPTPDYEAEFEVWWKAFPNSASRKASVRAYIKARKGTKVYSNDPPRTPMSAEFLLDHAERYAALVRRENRPIGKVLHGSTWLNGDRWTDNLPPARPVPAQVSGPVFEGSR